MFIYLQKSNRNSNAVRYDFDTVKCNTNNLDSVNCKADKRVSNGVPPTTAVAKSTPEMYTDPKENCYFRDPTQIPNFHQASKDDTIKYYTIDYSAQPMIYEALDGDADEPALYVAPVPVLRTDHYRGPQPQFYEANKPSHHLAQTVEDDDDDSEQPQLYLDVVGNDNEQEIYSGISDTNN